MGKDNFSLFTYHVVIYPFVYKAAYLTIAHMTYGPCW